jgi:hypothetical protein
MPIYFSTVAPTCPVSTDQSTGPRQAYLFNRPQFVRPTIPRAVDLSSALASANIARTIIQSLVVNKTINNVRDNIQTPPKGMTTLAPDKFKNKTARFVEQTDKRKKNNYVYYGETEDGDTDKDVWVVTERIERMVWYDRAWKSYMVWVYGSKGDKGKNIGKAIRPPDSGGGE